MSAAPGAPLPPLRRSAPLPCPSCGLDVPCLWVGCKAAGQQCPACGHEFEATWPGFTFEPETVIVRPGQEPSSDAA